MNTSQELLDSTYGSCASYNFAQIGNEMESTLGNRDAIEYANKDSVGNNRKYSRRSVLSVLESELTAAHDDPDGYPYSDVWYDYSSRNEVAL